MTVMIIIIQILLLKHSSDSAAFLPESFSGFCVAPE